MVEESQLLQFLLQIVVKIMRPHERKEFALNSEVHLFFSCLPLPEMFPWELLNKVSFNQHLLLYNLIYITVYLVLARHYCFFFFLQFACKWSMFSKITSRIKETHQQNLITWLCFSISRMQSLIGRHMDQLRHAWQLKDLSFSLTF